MISEDTALCFESKNPHTTLWLRVEFPEGQEPEELFAALAKIGWREDTRFARLPALDGVQEVKVSGPKGTELFGAWSAVERRAYMAACRDVLREFEFDGVPHYELTLEELL